jgi:hypothetical protein
MVWITYKFARVEQNCGRKGGLFNRLRIVETKARSRYLDDFKRVRTAFIVTHARVARSSDVRMYGATKVRTSKIEKGFRVNSLVYKTSNDGLSKFYD